MNNTQFYSVVQQTPNKKHTVITLSYVPISKKEKPLVIKIAPELGSNMFSMRYGNNDIIYHEPDVLAAAGFTGTFVLFPTPNRVANSVYIWKGRAITLKKRGAIIPNHGLVFDESWQFQKPIVTKTYCEVTTTIGIDKKSPLFEGYPFPCLLSLTYRVTSHTVSVTYTVKNLGNESMPFGFGLHPYFARLSGNDETYITIPAKSWMESPADTLLPTGKLAPVNYTKPAAVGSLHLDHVFTNLLKNKFATIDYKTKGFKVTLIATRDFTHMVVYTGHEKAVCIENQTCSTDAINLWNKGFEKESHVLVVPPHKSKKGTITYEIQLSQ